MDLITIFCMLVQIPSPSLHEEKVADKIIQLLSIKNITVKKDNYGNVIAKVKATDKNKESILISSHMDVMGDDSAVNIHYSDDKKYIHTDKTRPLGADDKAGAAVAIYLARQISQRTDLKHGGIELVFTRDEEKSMSGIKHLQMNELLSQYALVLDGDKLGNFEVSGAGYSHINLKVKTLIGGHSGIDIGDDKRLNALKLISEIMNEIPQGVYKRDSYGVVTSINAGAIVGGDGINSCVKNLIAEKIKNDDYISYIVKNSANNIINTQAQAFYSIRSSNKLFEKELLNQIQNTVEKYNKKYAGLAEIEAVYDIHLEPFEKPEGDLLEQIAQKAATKINLPIKIQSFHAGAETHIYSGKLNKNSQKIKPVLIGAANIYNMHSANEYVDVESLQRGYEFVEAFFEEFNK